MGMGPDLRPPTCQKPLQRLETLLTRASLPWPK